MDSEEEIEAAYWEGYWEGYDTYLFGQRNYVNRDNPYPAYLDESMNKLHNAWNEGYLDAQWDD